MMEASCIQFIEKMMGASLFLQKIGQETFEYWKPDCPPVTILYAAVGNELARKFDSIREETREVIFRCIEDGINSNDDALKSAVATGIIEALVSESAKNKNPWSRIESQLGTSSRRHADAWRSE